MRSPGMASDFDQEVATTERVTSGGTSGTGTSSKTSARYGSSLMSTIGPRGALQHRLDLDERGGG